jgi:hypothetical protein
MLSLQPSANFDTGEDSINQKATIGISNPSSVGFEVSDVKSEMTH